MMAYTQNSVVYLLEAATGTERRFIN